MVYHKKESLANFEKNIFFKSKVTHQKRHEAKEGMKIGGGNSGPVVPNTGALQQVPVLYVVYLVLRIRIPPDLKYFVGSESGFKGISRTRFL